MLNFATPPPLHSTQSPASAFVCKPRTVATRPPHRPAKARILCTGPGAADERLPSLQVGQIVAVQRGANRAPDVARVTGGASSGETVDLQLLQQFVKELYVDAKDGSTFERAADIRPVPSEFVASQQGWIVLNQDLTDAADYFASRPMPTSSAKASVDVVDSRQPPSALNTQRQMFRPTVAQSFLAAALSLPLSAALYSAFASVRGTYAANPAGDDLLNGQLFRTIVLGATSAGSLAALIVGAALFLYAVQQRNDAD